MRYLGAFPILSMKQNYLRTVLSLAAVLFAPLAAFAQDAVTIEVESNDQMQFNKKAIEVTTGQQVTIVLKHVGKLPKAAMGHNFVLLKPGTAAPAFGMKAMSAAATGYIPADEESKKLVLGHTDLIGGGETAQFTFTAPEPGAYPYLCTFPGHFALMNGVLTVKAK